MTLVRLSLSSSPDSSYCASSWNRSPITRLVLWGTVARGLVEEDGETQGEDGVVVVLDDEVCLVLLCGVVGECVEEQDAADEEGEEGEDATGG